MPRISLIASAVALALVASTAQAQQFSNVISFGDSLSDAGNVAALNGLPAGFSFTTNPDPVSVQLIAAAFGVNMTNISPFIPGSSGTDYAYGGACVQPNSVTFTCGLSPGSFSLTTQVTGYLAGGGADPNALYTMWGGANDLFTYATLAGAGLITPNQALAGTATAAGTEVGLIDALQHAGARNILVFNLPNIAVTPDAAAQATAAGQAAAAAVLGGGGTAAQATAAAQQAGAAVLQSLAGLSLTFNSTLNLGMAGRTGIIPVDVFGLVNEVIASPAAYGFTNTTGTACSTGPGIGGSPSSVACGPASLAGQLPFTYAAGTNQSYFFADGVHPTGAGHALLAQYVLAELSAPGQISMLGEAPLQIFDAQSRVLETQMQADMAHTRANGSLRTFAAFDYGHQRWDATVNSPNTSSNNATLTFGGDYAVNDNVTLGGITTLGHQDASFAGGGGFRNTEPFLSAFGLWHCPDGYVSLQAGIGQLNFNDVQRVFNLGAATRTETGDTGGSHTGVELAGGYWFHWGDVKTGPFASINHQRVHVDSYIEKGSDSSTMAFGRQNRDSTVYKIGWQLAGDSKFFDTNWHPFGRVAYEHESDDNARNVTAGLATLNGTFSLPSYQPESSWWSAELGVSAEFGDNLVGYVSYSGLFGNSTQRVDSGNIGIKFSF